MTDAQDRFFELVRQRDAAEERAAELVIALSEAHDTIQGVVMDEEAIKAGLFQGPLYPRVLAFLEGVLAKSPEPTDAQLRKYHA